MSREENGSGLANVSSLFSVKIRIGPRGLYVEPKIHHIAVLHDVVLAL